jgi:hypothetical protein
MAAAGARGLTINQRIFLVVCAPGLVMSPFLAIIACLILVTSAPPAYKLEDISQFAVTLAQGLGPFLSSLTSFKYASYCSTFVFFLYSISFFRCAYNLLSSSLAATFLPLFSSSSYYENSKHFLFLSS